MNYQGRLAWIALSRADIWVVLGPEALDLETRDPGQPPVLTDRLGAFPGCDGDPVWKQAPMIELQGKSCMRNLKKEKRNTRTKWGFQLRDMLRAKLKFLGDNRAGAERRERTGGRRASWGLRQQEWLPAEPPEGTGGRFVGLGLHC